MNLDRKSFMRTGLIGIPAALLGTAAYMRFFESGHLELTRKTLPLRGISRKVRLLHLSDLHASSDVPFSLISEAIRIGLAEQPDLACITGDFVTLMDESDPDPEAYVESLRPLAEACPVFASLGNHDGGPWTHAGGRYPEDSEIHAITRRAGIRLFLNEEDTIRIGEQPLRIVGLGDIWMADFRPRRVLPARSERTGQPTTIVLSHNPDSKVALRSYAWDLTLCGHTHGGQLTLPFINWRPFLPVQDKSFPEGLLRWEDRYVHITRGVGSILGMRLNCRPEVSILDLVPPEQDQESAS